MKLIVLFVIISIGNVIADVYFHNPRGSNNRLNKPNRDTANQNRLFDSQNNARGGYNVGEESMFYYEGTQLEIEWTNQHSCGNENSNCEIIIQYMCGPNVRDGTSSSTSKGGNVCKKRDCNTDTEYGMHEDYHYYLQCRNRERNQRLFTADQDLNDDDAGFTRQNPDGERHGYECPEERDYYPYWHPTPWKDIVVMTNDISRCEYYQQESENVKGRGMCVLEDEEVLVQDSNNGRFVNLPNNREECEEFEHVKKRKEYRAKWVEFEPHGLQPPDCIQSPWSRDNHNGNGIGGYHNKYVWTIPESINSEHNCVLRTRYNISTNDFDSWEVTSESNDDPHLISYFGNDKDTTEERGFVYEGNPAVQIFPGLGLELNLAINTAQYGRTFQDRSHVFKVYPRENYLKDATIHNLNVRGKRGNLQQVFPATEYDFVPNTLTTEVGDYIHFKWTGSNSNPDNNDGNGPEGTDRSNVIMLAPKPFHNTVGPVSHWARNYPAYITNSSLLGLDNNLEIDLALRGLTENDEGAYYNQDPLRITDSGTFYYMSTRNNDFTNRCQKARIQVDDVSAERRLLSVLRRLDNVL